MDDAEFRRAVGKRITYYRKLCGLTQLEMAEKLNYSDKSVSKWERGEGLPDLFVFYQLAELLGIQVGDLVYDTPPKPSVGSTRMRLLRGNKKILIPLLAVGLVWLLASVVFCALKLLPSVPFDLHLIYVYAVPVSCIVLIVFSCIWWNLLCRALCVSAFAWTACAAAFLTVHNDNMRFFFIIAAVFQVLTILWFLMRFLGKRAKKIDDSAVQ